MKLVMIALSLAGFYQSLHQEQQINRISAKNLIREGVTWLLLIVLGMVPALCTMDGSLLFMLKGAFSSLISFGGGDAYLVVADGLFVNDGTLTDEMFYGTLVPIVNVLPGSILCKTLTGIGYLLGYGTNHSYLTGIVMAVLGYVTSVVASGMVFCIGYYIFQRYKKLDIFHLLRRLIKPIISGLLITVMLSLLKQNIHVGEQAAFGPAVAVIMMFLIFVANLYLSRREKCSNALLVALSAVTSCLLCNLWQFLF